MKPAPLEIILVATSDRLGEMVQWAAVPMMVRIRQATGETDCLALLREHRVDLLIVGGDLADDPAQVERVRAGNHGSHLMMVKEIGGNPPSVDAAFKSGYDQVIHRDANAAEVGLLFRLAGRLRDLSAFARDRIHELHRVQRAAIREQAEIVAVLSKLLDSGAREGIETRARVKKTCQYLAGRFAVPHGFVTDLENAARLYELGRLSMRGEPQSREAAARHCAMASHALVSEIGVLREVAALIGSMYENWDGSGTPAHLRQGQIPLRSRILRVAVDFVTAGGEEAGLVHLRDHAGTSYDPLVVAQVENMVANGGEGVRPDCRHLEIHQLTVGMVLAEDLYTESGIKLVARDTSITNNLIETIQRRHNAEPLLRGAVVRLR
jgi:hypothetical protein